MCIRDSDGAGSQKSSTKSLQLPFSVLGICVSTNPSLACFAVYEWGLSPQTTFPRRPCTLTSKWEWSIGRLKRKKEERSQGSYNSPLLAWHPQEWPLFYWPFSRCVLQISFCPCSSDPRLFLAFFNSPAQWFSTCGSQPFQGCVRPLENKYIYITIPKCHKITIMK